jgi:hypothetical protein
MSPASDQDDEFGIMPLSHSSTYRGINPDSRATSSTVIVPLPAMTRNSPVFTPT